MAEVVGLVTGVAGLTPLVAGVVGGIRRLRRIRRDSTEIPEGLDAIIKELGFLQMVIENAGTIFRGPGAEHCQGSITAVAKGIEELLDKFPLDSISAGKKPKLKEAWDLRYWEEGIKALRETIERSKQDLMLYLGLVQAMQLNSVSRMIQTENLGMASGFEASSSSDLTTKSEALSSPPPIKDTPLRRAVRRDCAVNPCSCSCHQTSRISRRFWALEYSGLFPPRNKCDQETCTASASGFRLRVALSQLGIPWSVTVGLRLLAGIGSFSIQPALQMERVVKYTSPGFEIIWKLKHRVIMVDEACMGFRRLAQEDPSLHLHVDPSGSSYVETLLELPWGNTGFGASGSRKYLDDQLSLLQVLMSESEVTLGTGNQSFLASLATWFNGNVHLYLMKTALELGFDPTTIDSPVVTEWSGAWLCQPWTRDLFLLQFLTLLCKDNQGFAGMTPLHEAVLFGQPEDVQRWVPRSKKNERNVLGQTPLHLAVSQPQYLQVILDAGHDPDAFDRDGNTPLMYAAAFNKVDSAKLLIRAGADPFIGQSTSGGSFVETLFFHAGWDFALDLLRFLDDEATQTMAEMLATGIVSLLFVVNAERWGGSDCLPQLLSRCESLDFYPEFLPGDKVVEGRTLLHYARSAEKVDALLGHGLTMINQVDQTGQHALMTVISEANATFDLVPLVERLLDAGADIDLQDNRGHTTCHIMMQYLSDYRNWAFMGGIDCLHTLVTRGADVLIVDNCRCSCSVSGCLPLVPTLKKEPTYFEQHPGSSAVLLIESIILVFETRGMNTAEQILLATIQRAEHEKLGMTHTCCRKGTYYPGHDSDLISEDDIDEILEEESEFTRILDDKMDQESKKDFNSLLRNAILDTKPPMDQTGHRSWPEIDIGEGRTAPRHYVDHQNDRFVVENGWDPDYSSNQIRLVVICASSYVLWLERRFSKSESSDQATRNPWRDGYLRRLSWLHYLCNVMEISTEELIVGLRHMVAHESKMTGENKSDGGDIEHFYQSWEEWGTKGPAMVVGSTDGFADWPLEETGD